jgi:hypothetical protein
MMGRLTMITGRMLCTKNVGHPDKVRIAHPREIFKDRLLLSLTQVFYLSIGMEFFFQLRIGWFFRDNTFPDRLNFENWVTFQQASQLINFNLNP